MSFTFYSKELKNNASAYADYIPYYMLLDEVTCLNKDNIFMAVFQYIGHDLDLVDWNERMVLNHRLNHIIKNLDDSWGIHIENSRKKVILDHSNDHFFTNDVALEFEQDRKEMLLGDRFYQSFKYISVSYQPRKFEKAVVNKILFKTSEEKTDDFYDVAEYEFFKNEVSKIFHSFTTVFKEITFLSNNSLLSFLNYTTTLKNQNVALPSDTIDLDLLFDNVIVNTEAPLKVGKYYVLNATIMDFPGSTRLEMLKNLDYLNIEHRYVTRYIPISIEKAKSMIKKRRNLFSGSRVGLLAGAFSKQTGEEVKENTDAIVMELETEEALAVTAEDIIGFGYITSTIQVYAEDYEECENNFHTILKIVNTDFLARQELINSFQCWLSSLPGNFQSNCRKSLLNSFNFSHLILNHSSWNGVWENKHLKKLTNNDYPHMVVMSNDFSPFFLNLNVKDIGHTFIAGGTGSGKSTLLATLAIQFLRYPGARVLFFDKDKSAYNLTKKVGGAFYEPAIFESEGSIVFQPLRIEPLIYDEASDSYIQNIDDINFAITWVNEICEINGLTPNPQQKKDIQQAVYALVQAPSNSKKTLTYLHQYIQAPEVKEIIKNYTNEGQFGYIFDGDFDDLGDNLGFWTLIEMGELIKKKDEVLVPALSYLFYKIEKNLTVGGPPGLIILDEAWVFLKNAIFAPKIEEWLKVLRKKNTYVLIATQEIADIVKAQDLIDTILNSCVTNIYLANPKAKTEQIQKSYYSLGLSELEIYNISEMQIQQEYMFKNEHGTRIFDLCLSRNQLSILMDRPDTNFEKGGVEVV